MSKQTVKWGVLGYARIAINSIIPAIQQNDASQLYAVASRSPEKLEACRTAFGCEKTYLSYDALLDDPEVTAVYIPLPNSLHKKWTLKALEKGKHVLCEKPIGLNAEECQQMMEAASRNNVLLMEAYMYRYTDRIKKVSELLKRGVIGDVKYISSTFRFLLDRPNTIKVQPELGGGSLYDVGGYPVNFVGMIMHDLPVAYQAECVVENGVDVIFSGTLKYENGTIATVNSGFNAHKTMRSEIVGTKGVIEIPDTFEGTAGKISVITSQGQQEIAVAESDRYLLEVAHFANAILHRGNSLLPLAESLQNMTVIENLLKAANLDIV